MNRLFMFIGGIILIIMGLISGVLFVIDKAYPFTFLSFMLVFTGFFTIIVGCEE